MNSRVYEELLVKKNDHILNGTEDFSLDARGAIGFAQSHEIAQDICHDTSSDQVKLIARSMRTILEKILQANTRCAGMRDESA